MASYVKCHFYVGDYSYCGVVALLSHTKIVPLKKRKKEKKRTYLVISKLQPFRRSKALFRMMPLSLPRYTFLSEFMGAGRAAEQVDSEKQQCFFPRGKKVKKKNMRDSERRKGKKRNGLAEKEERKNTLTLGPPQRSK